MRINHCCCVLAARAVFAFIAFSAFALSSCADAGERSACDSMVLSMPAWPPYGSEAFPPLDHWQVRIVGARAEEAHNVPNEGCIMAEIEKGETTAIIAEPVTKHCGCTAAFFRPAGCVLPSSSAISWEGGYAASVCAALFRAVPDSRAAMNTLLAKFNWARFAAETAFRSADTQKGTGLAVICDPWTLDNDKVCNGILFRTFTATLITPTVAQENRTVQDTSALQALAVSITNDMPLLPRYIPAFRQQQGNGKVRLVSDKYAAEKNITGGNLFLCGDSLASYGVAIRGSGSSAVPTVKAAVSPAAPAAFLRYGIDAQ